MIEVFSEHYFTYQKIKYICSIIFLTAMGIFKLSNENNPIILSVASIFALSIMNVVVAKNDEKMKHNYIVIFGFIELSIYNVFDYFFPVNSMLMTLWTLLIISSGLSFILNSTEFDKATVFYRKILFLIPLVVKILFSFTNTTEPEWFCYLFIQFILSVIIFSVADAYMHLNETYESVKRKLTIEKSNIESNNEKLLDYQEKVKTINEQINYQKIDLGRTLKELEQVNIEIESQTEIIKYMASTFDVLKCMNVITDSIMDVKKTKLCAFYVDKDVYQNKEASCIIKTNYTSMQRRLKKDIDKIYEQVLKSNIDSCRILKFDQLSIFKFIGDANINSLAFLPIKDKKKTYGFMVVGDRKSTRLNSSHAT